MSQRILGIGLIVPVISEALPKHLSGVCKSTVPVSSIGDFFSYLCQLQGIKGTGEEPWLVTGVPEPGWIIIVGSLRAAVVVILVS